MMKSQNDLIDRIVSDLNIAGIGVDLEPAVLEDLIGRTQSLADDLNARRIAYIPDVNQLDDGAFESIVIFMAAMIGPGYGRQAIDPATKEIMENAIKSACRTTAPRRTLSTDPFLRQGSRRVYSPFTFTNG